MTSEARKTFARGAASMERALPTLRGTVVRNGRLMRDGMVAVVIARGYGGGWSANCFREEQELRAFDPELAGMIAHYDEVIRREDMAGNRANVEVFEALKISKTRMWARDHFGRDSYEAERGVKTNLTVVWVPEGEEFIIEEYDGAESVRLKNLTPWLKA